MLEPNSLFNNCHQPFMQMNLVKAWIDNEVSSVEEYTQKPRPNMKGTRARTARASKSAIFEELEDLTITNEISRKSIRKL